MSFSIQYREYFRVDIFHRYFLNKGTDTFESMPQDIREKQLEGYNHLVFFEVNPTPDTIAKLNGHKLVFRKDNRGVSVWGQVSEGDQLKPFIDIDDGLSLTFLIGLKDPKFLNYTNLKPENATNIYYFSNNLPENEPATFPLINISGEPGFIDENYLLSPTTVKEELDHIPFGMRKNLFGIIRVFMKGENNTLNITDSEGNVAATPVVFEISFDNQKTIWRYIFKSDQTVASEDDVATEDGNSRILVTKNLMPLTSLGFIRVSKGDSELPNAGITSIIPDTINNKIYSEIFM